MYIQSRIPATAYVLFYPGMWNYFIFSFLISSGIIHLTASQSSGQLQSPNYPDNYPVNTECVWTINAPGNEQVQLDFPVAIDMQHAGKYVSYTDERELILTSYI